MVSSLSEQCSVLRGSPVTMIYLSEHMTDIYKQCGVYQLKCNECPLMYVGQTGCTFKDLYRDHIQATGTNKQTNKTKFAQHILERARSKKQLRYYKQKKKGHLLNSLERFHIYNLSNKMLEMNYTFADLHNSIFDPLINNPQYNIHSQNTSHPTTAP
jgi:hypothetical protein